MSLSRPNCYRSHRCQIECYHNILKNINTHLSAYLKYIIKVWVESWQRSKTGSLWVKAFQETFSWSSFLNLNFDLSDSGSTTSYYLTFSNYMPLHYLPDLCIISGLRNYFTSLLICYFICSWMYLMYFSLPNTSRICTHSYNPVKDP